MRIGLLLVLSSMKGKRLNELFLGLKHFFAILGAIDGKNIFLSSLIDGRWEGKFLDAVG